MPPGLTYLLGKVASTSHHGGREQVTVDLVSGRRMIAEHCRGVKPE